jgi:hypothetical protein
MATIQTTATGNHIVRGIGIGREFSLVATGTFDGASVTAKFATAPPATASLAIDDADEPGAIILTAAAPGSEANAISIEIVHPDVILSPLTITQDGLAFTVSAATDEGDPEPATVDIGAGANGTVTITTDQLGPSANLYDVAVVASEDADADLSAAAAVDEGRTVLTVTLGTDEEGDPDDAKNTAELVAGVIDDLDGFSAAFSGTGADAVAASALDAFEGGTNATLITTTSADLVAKINAELMFKPHFSAALKAEYDGAGLIEVMAEDSLENGTDGTFTVYSTDAVSLTAAGEIIATNPGVIPAIQIAVADADTDTSIGIIVNEIPQ